MEQWRRLVSELIHVCYRMSDVVSPVVQSSSPEGLIPMDSDSGNPSRNVLPYSEAPGQIQSFQTCSDIPRVCLDRNVGRSAEDPAGDSAQRHE